MRPTTKKYYYRLNECKEEIEKLYTEGISRGLYMGWETMHEYFSFKPEGTTYVYGSPFSGKSEWIFDVLVYLSENYGFHHAIFSPETGQRKDIYAELISKYVQKPFHKNYEGAMSETERMRAEDFVNEYFIIVEQDEGELTIDEFYVMVDEMEKHYGLKINTTTVDPFNELKHDMAAEEGRQDLYIENKLGMIRRNALAKKRHNIIITHVRDQGHPIVRDGFRYFPAATPREIAGGQAWYRKAMNMICVWRPPLGLPDENGIPAEENETHLIIQKFKPKGVGKRGTVKLFFDLYRNRFYEKIDGNNRYAGPQAKNPYQTKVQYDEF